MIEPVPLPPSEPEPAMQSPGTEPVVLEDLAALIRLPTLFAKLDRVLLAMRANHQFPSDFPLNLLSTLPGDGIREYGLSWADEQRQMRLFAGMTWGNQGHDPIWDVRVELLPPLDPAILRSGGLHRIAARRAESRFSDWDRFWFEDDPKSHVLFGASALCTRFFEEPNPDAMAANYLASALYALQTSGTLQALLAAIRER